MALRKMLENNLRSAADWLGAMKERDTAPLEATPLRVRSISSLDDLRAAVEMISREKEAAGGESFEEFWDFGDDEEFAALDDLPAPAQLKAQSILEAHSYNFREQIEKDQAAAHERARNKLKDELRKELESEKTPE